MPEEMLNEQGQNQQVQSPQTQEATEDFRSKYETERKQWENERKQWEKQQNEWKAQQSTWQGEREKLSSRAKLADQWEGYYNSYMAPHYGEDRDAFHADLVSWLEQKAQHGTRAEKQEAREQLSEMSAQEGNYITPDQVARMLMERDQYYQNALPQLVQQQTMQLRQHLLQELTGNVIPKAFTLYDDVASIRAKNGEDPEFNFNDLVNTMREKGLGPQEAYSALYGDRDRKREIEAAEKRAYEKAKLDLAAEANKNKVRVLRGNGVAPKTDEGIPRNAEEGKQAAYRELVQKRGTNFLGDSSWD